MKTVKVKANTVLLLLCWVTATKEAPVDVDHISPYERLMSASPPPFSSDVVSPIPHVGEASTSKTTATDYNPKHVKTGPTSYTELRKMSLAELVLRRPHRARAREGLRWTTAFNQHPEMKKLDPKKLTSQEYELAFRKLRGESKGGIYARKWTHALKRCLRDQNAPNCYIDRVLYQWKSYSEPPTQRKWASKRRNKMQITTDPNLIQQMKSDREKYRIRSQERRNEMKVNQLGIREQNIEAALEKLVETRIPTGLDINSMEEYLRPLLDEEPDEKANNEALKLFLEPKFGTDFAQGVVACRRITRRKASMRKSQQKLHKFKMDKRRLAKIAVLPNDPVASSGQSESLDEHRGGSETQQPNQTPAISFSPPAPAKFNQGLTPERDLAASPLPTAFTLDDRQWWEGWYN